MYKVFSKAVTISISIILFCSYILGSSSTVIAKTLNNTEKGYIYRYNHIKVITQNESDDSLTKISEEGKTIDLPNHLLKIKIFLDENVLNEHIGMPYNLNNPGKTTINALEGYEIESIKLDGENFENGEEITFKSDETSKELVIILKSKLDVSDNEISESQNLKDNEERITTIEENNSISFYEEEIQSAMDKRIEVSNSSIYADSNGIYRDSSTKQVVYCLNSELKRPNVDLEIYIPGEVPSYFNDNKKVKDLLKIIMWAGYPNNGAYLYEINSGKELTLEELNDLFKPTAEMLSDEEFMDFWGYDAREHDLEEYFNNDTFKKKVDKWVFSSISPEQYFSDSYYYSEFYKICSILSFYAHDEESALNFYNNFFSCTKEKDAYYSTSLAIWQMLYKEGIPNNKDESLAISVNNLAEDILEFAYSIYNNLEEPDNWDMSTDSRFSHSDFVLNTSEIMFNWDLDNKKWISTPITITTPFDTKPIDVVLPSNMSILGVLPRVDNTYSVVSGTYIFEFSQPDGLGDGSFEVKNNFVIPYNNLMYYKSTNEEYQHFGGFDSIPALITKNVSYHFNHEKIEVSVTKIWNDKNNQDGIRPESIIVRLLDDNKEEVAQAVIKADDLGNWKYTFTGIPKYKDGQLINYSIVEDVVDEYTPEYNNKGNDFTITNSYTPGKTSIKVVKAWNDNNDQDGIRPNNIKVQLYANDKKSGSEVTLSKENNWSYTWVDIDEKSKGEYIEYSVKEITKVDGYETIVESMENGNVVITNTHIPATTYVEVKKTWDDNNNQDGKRPNSIKVNLLADGEIIKTATITGDKYNNWRYKFTDLPEYKDGKKIIYTISEERVKGYTTVIDGYNITNTYVGKDISNININNPQSMNNDTLPNTGKESSGLLLGAILIGLGGVFSLNYKKVYKEN